MQDFKKLNIWNKALVLTKDIYLLSSNFPKDERFGIVTQMRRASISVASNIAEGAGRKTNNDFAHFLDLARGSLNELETQLILSEQLLFTKSVTHICSEIDDLRKMIYSFSQKLRSEN